MTTKDLKTSISMIKPGKILIRGYDLIDLIGHISFGDMVYLLFAGELPKKNEGKMIEAILVCSAEHGMATPSTNIVRSAVSGGVPLQAAVASAVIGLGDFHGGAIEGCAEMLQNHISLAREKGFESAASEVVANHREAKKRIMGYGHGIHQPEDPRKDRLFRLAEQHGISSDHMTLAESIEMALKNVLGKPLPLNVDGAVGAIISDLGLDWRFGKAFFYLGRSAGLTAHAYEYMVNERPMRRVYTWDEITYVGPEERKP
jgi:citrate synthase